MEGDKLMFDKKSRIETERLLIRPFTEEDSEAMLEIQSNFVMTKYTPDEPWRSIEDAKEFIKLVFWLYGSEHHTFRHFFAVTEKESGKLIGFCGVGGIEYNRAENEVFYSIHSAYWGRGYATEAGRAMLEYGFERLELLKVIGAVHTENVASIRVIEKIGLKRIGVIKDLPKEFNGYNGEYLYALNRDEYMGGAR